MLAPFPVTPIVLVPWFPEVRYSLYRAVVSHRGLIGHPGPYIFDIIEYVFGFDTFDVPLAGHICIVTGLLHILRPESAGFGLLLKLRLKFMGHPQKPAGIKHCPAGHTYRAMPAALIICVRKSNTVSNKPVKIRRFYFITAHCAQRFKTLVIGKDEQDIGFVVFL